MKNKPNRSEILSIKAVYVNHKTVTLHIRLRGQTKWLHYDTVLGEGSTIIISDAQGSDHTPESVGFTTEPIEDEDHE